MKKSKASKNPQETRAINALVPIKDGDHFLLKKIPNLRLYTLFSTLLTEGFIPENETLKRDLRTLFSLIRLSDPKVSYVRALGKNVGKTTVKFLTDYCQFKEEYVVFSTILSREELQTIGFHLRRADLREEDKYLVMKIYDLASALVQLK